MENNLIEIENLKNKIPIIVFILFGISLPIIPIYPTTPIKIYITPEITKVKLRSLWLLF